LDVGCGNGEFTFAMKKSGLAKEVWGVEIFESAAKEAATRLDKVLFGDVSGLMETLPKKYFDAVYFNDSLEHMVDPFTVLSKMKEHIAPGGYVIASLPNVRHFRTLFELIFKKDWQYRDQGVLDHTHLRFFTQKSARRMFENAGFKVELSRGIQPSKKWYLYILNFLTLGFFRDSLFFQFAWRVRV
jgi:2-polyprenyl-3-methyl-5-hydroxy-6-metoxy-1,4-benzoquinol methylase